MFVIENTESKTETEADPVQKNTTETEPNPVQENDFFSYTIVDTHEEAMAVLRHHEQVYAFRFAIYHVARDFGNIGIVFYVPHQGSPNYGPRTGCDSRHLFVQPAEIYLSFHFEFFVQNKVTEI